LAHNPADVLTVPRQVGLYKTPVVVLDFASLYPSLFRAHNMCYTTLVHEEDVAALPPDSVFTAPTGCSFVKPAVRQGMLPAILAALIEVRRRCPTLFRQWRTLQLTQTATLGILPCTDGADVCSVPSSTYSAALQQA
jgi:hypothetical protein